MFAASKTAASGSAPDAQFNYVTLLLHGDGTNGAQNNTFVDGSTNNFTITRNGNTTQGSFSPYGSGWSNYFGTDANKLSLSNSTPLNLSGGSFTIEGWINPLGIYSTSSGSSGFMEGYNTIVGKRAEGVGCAWEVYLNTSNGVLSFFNGTNYQSSTTPTANVWSHFAAVFDGTNISLYLNGSRVLGPTALTNTDYSVPIYIGSYLTASGHEQFRGYISNLRITKGGALYSGSTYTVPTSALTTTVASGTVSLLTCQGNRFVDASVNAATVSISVGAPSVQRFNPFGTSTAYSTSVIGGSAYFDGSGDCLKFPTNSGLLGSNDFSFEAWVYPVTLSSIAVISTGQSDLGSAAGSAYGFYVSPSGDASDLFVGSTTYSVTSPNPKIGAWNHVAWVRTGTTFSSYLNGVRVSTTSVSGSVNNGDTTYPASIGGFSNGPVGRPFNGYISGYQRIIGSGGYNATSSTITIPTTPPTAVTNTNALLNFTNGAIFDNAMMNDLETVGNAQISTSVKKFGTGSMYFDGTSDYLYLPPSQNFAFGSGNFTIEFWGYNLTQSGNWGVFSFGATVGSDYAGITMNAGGGLFISTTGSSWSYLSIGSITLSTNDNTWHHYAIVRNGSSLLTYKDGVQQASTSISGTLVNNAGAAIIGAKSDALSNTMTGYLDDFRVSKYARYTGSSFIPPTAAFSDKGPI
jgi:hypothetical protein